jgi:hypothetical protein
MVKSVCRIVYFMITTFTTCLDAVHAQDTLIDSWLPFICRIPFFRQRKCCSTTSTCKEDAVGNEYGMYEGTFEGWRIFVNYTSQGITVDNWPESVGPFYCGMRTPQIPHTIEKGRIIWFEEKDYGPCPSHDVQLTFKNVNKQWIYNHSWGGDFRGPMNFTCFK